MSDDEATNEEQRHNCSDLHWWFITSGLNRKTETVICKEELTTVGALVMLEPSDLCELGLPYGRRKLLQRVLLALCPKQPPQAAPTDEGTTTQPGPSEDGPELSPVQATWSANHQAHDLQGTEPITIADVRCQVQTLNAAGIAFDSIGLGTDGLTTPQPTQATAAGTSLTPPRPC